MTKNGVEKNTFSIDCSSICQRLKDTPKTDPTPLYNNKLAQCGFIASYQMSSLQDPGGHEAKILASILLSHDLFNHYETRTICTEANIVQQSKKWNKKTRYNWA